MLLKKAVVLAVSLASLVLTPITANATIVRHPSCTTYQAISGGHFAIISPSVTGNVLATVYLVYDSCDYVTFAQIDASGRGYPNNYVSVDLVYGDGANDSNAHIIAHADTYGNPSSLTAITNAASLNAYGPGKFFQARGYYDDGANCKIYFDSNWHGYATGADTGGGWDGSCSQY